MPYLRCPTCSLLTYSAGTEYARDACPSCDTPLPRRARSDHPRWGEPDDDAVRDPQLVARVLELARSELDMDVAFLGEIRDGREVLRAVVGADDPRVQPGVSFPLHDTICGAVLEGRVGNAVPDVAGEPGCARLPMPRGAGINAYVGVPITAHDARLYMLCCLAREARPTLGEREVQAMQGFAESVRSALRPPD